MSLVSPDAPVRIRIPDGELQRVNAPQTFWRGFTASVREVWTFRELLGDLVRKELKVKYKGSVLGFVWSLLLPLFQLGIYWIVMGQFLGGGVIPAYGVFIFCGLAVWTLFSEIIGSSTSSIVVNAGLIKKVYFPRELFPLASIGAALANFAFQLVILVSATTLACVISGDVPDFSLLPLPIIALVCLLVFACGLGLLLAAANVYLRDVQHLITIVLMLWFWMTPIVYDISRVAAFLPNWLYEIYLLNPMATVTFAFQKFFWPQGSGSGFDFDGNMYLHLAGLLAFSCLFLWFAQRVFARAQGNFAQEL